MKVWFVLEDSNGPVGDASSANLPNETDVDGLKEYLKDRRCKSLLKDVDIPLLKVYEKDEEGGMNALDPDVKIGNRGKTKAKALLVVAPGNLVERRTPNETDSLLGRQTKTCPEKCLESTFVCRLFFLI
jgi:hypothetical protein